MNIKEIKDYFDIKQKSDIIIKFTAEWCVPCSMMYPILQEVSEEFKFTIIDVDVEEDNNIFNKFNINSLPTIIIIKGDKFVRKEGALNKYKLIDLIKSL